MKPKKLAGLVLMALVFASLACNLPGSISPQPSATPTLTLEPLPLPTDLPTSPVPDVTAEASVTPVPPTDVPPANPYLPAGFAASPTTGDAVTLYDPSGSPLAVLTVPQLNGGQPPFFHMAAPLSMGAESMPVIYYSIDSGSQMLSSQGGAASPLRSEAMFYAMLGVPAQPVVTFATLDYITGGVNTNLYLSDLASIPSAQPLMSIFSSEGYAVKPLGILLDEGAPAGIFYSMVPNGIGGDIVFEPRYTLKYLDLSRMQVIEYLGTHLNPVGISPDLTWMAYTSVDTPQAVTLAPLAEPARQVAIPLLPDSDRGAGDAYFSPDNQYIAWKEGSGFLMADTPNFHATIRIATLDGTITAEILDSSLNGIAGPGNISWVRPVGWLDNQTLMLEVHKDTWEDVSLLRVNFDGSGLAFLADGHFLGFAYP